MQEFIKHTGETVAVYQPNIDTDQIIPKQFLTRIERAGYCEFLFYDWRFNADETLKPDFVLNQPRYKDASVLLAGANFGCGSFREHALWSLTEYGFRAVIAPSLADIFYSNAMKNGLLPVRLSQAAVAELARNSNERENYELTIDLENLTITDKQDFQARFEIDDFHRQCLLDGLDDIALTLQNEGEIRNYENSRRSFLAV